MWKVVDTSYTYDAAHGRIELVPRFDVRSEKNKVICQVESYYIANFIAKNHNLLYDLVNLERNISNIIDIRVRAQELLEEIKDISTWG